MGAQKVRRKILIADLGWIGTALLIAYALRYGVSEPIEPLWKACSVFAAEFAVAAALWFLLHEQMKLDSFRGGWNLPAVISRTFMGVFCLMTIILSVAYLATEYVSRLLLFYFGFLLFAGFLGIRLLAHRFLKSRLANDARRRVVIVGAGRTARELAARIERHPEVLWEVVGYLNPFDTYLEQAAGVASSQCLPVQTLGIVDLLKSYAVEEMVLVGASGSHGEMLNLAARCRSVGIQVSLVPQLYELYLSRPNLLDLDGLPVLQLPSPTPLLAGEFKRGMDLILSCLLLIPATPIVLVSALLLWRQKSRAFCWDVRVGLQGEHFRMLRMNVDRRSSTLTALEKVLVELSITELPQLFNVIKGDMSLVGPRPEGLDRVSRYSAWEAQRLAVKPGVTGLAQVHGLRDGHSTEEKCRFDLQYLLDASPFLDISLLLQTIWTIISRASHIQTAVSGPATSAPGFTFSKEIVPGAHRSESGTD